MKNFSVEWERWRRAWRWGLGPLQCRPRGESLVAHDGSATRHSRRERRSSRWWQRRRLTPPPDVRGAIADAAVDARVLLITANGTEPPLPAIQSTLDTWERRSTC